MTGSPVSWHTLRDEDGNPQTMTTTIPVSGLGPAYAMMRLVAGYLSGTDAAEHFTATATPAYLYIDLRPNVHEPLPGNYAAIANGVTTLLASAA